MILEGGLIADYNIFKGIIGLEYLTLCFVSDFCLSLKTFHCFFVKPLLHYITFKATIHSNHKLFKSFLINSLLLSDKTETETDFLLLALLIILCIFIPLQFTTYHQLSDIGLAAAQKYKKYVYLLAQMVTQLTPA